MVSFAGISDHELVGMIEYADRQSLHYTAYELEFELYKRTKKEYEHELEKADNELSRLSVDLKNLEPSDVFSEDDFDEWLDELYPECSVAGHSFCASRALKELDLTAYRSDYLDWCDSQDITQTEEYMELKDALEDAERYVQHWEQQLEELEEPEEPEEPEDE